MNEERKFNEWLRSKLPGHFQRIESSTGSGIPDINVAYLGKEIWIESKIVLPRGILLRKEQYAWGTRRSRHGDVFVVAFLPEEFIEVYKYPFHIQLQGKYLKICDSVKVFRKEDSEKLIRYLFGQS